MGRGLAGVKITGCDGDGVLWILEGDEGGKGCDLVRGMICLTL